MSDADTRADEFIIEMVEAGRYEVALGVRANASRAEAASAFIRLSARHSGHDRVLIALNKARSAMLSETNEERSARLSWISRLVTGAHAFPADTPLTSAAKRFSDPSVSAKKMAPELHDNWEHAINHCLERDPNARFSSGSEVAAALSDPTFMSQGFRRHRRRAFLATAALILLLVIAGTAYQFRGRLIPGNMKARFEAIRIESLVNHTPIHSIAIEKSGGVDPLDEGFKLYQPEEPKYEHDPVLYNRETNGWDRWRIRSDRQNYYYRPLSAAEKDFARQQDWKLTCICALEAGAGFNDVDLGNRAGRFDIVFLQEGDRYFVALTKQISPKFEWAEKIEFPGVADVAHPHTYELRFDHVTQSASLWIDGHQMYSGYQGHRQYLEGRGLMFGTAIYGNAERGSFVFRTVRFEVD